MAKEAERLLAGSGWLPEPLRARQEDQAVAGDGGDADGAGAGALPAFLTGAGDPGEGGEEAPAEAA